MVALEYEGNPIKAQGDKALVPRLTQQNVGMEEGGHTQ